MNRRSWLDLSRKLVDRLDMDYTLDGIQAGVGSYAAAWFGEGVLKTTIYPNPFPLTMSNIALGGSVGNGIAFDVNGQITAINPSPDQPITFSLNAADPTHPRWDLLCIEYKQVGDTLIPKPSDPLVSVFLNLHDDFQLVVVPGIASASPVYPAKGDPLLIILAGLQVPATSTLGTQVIIDYTERENAQASQFSFPVFVQEIPTGVINGVNAIFNLSQAPINNASVIVRLDGRTLMISSDFTIVGQVLTMDPSIIPATGQSLSVYYVVNSVGSVNPISMAQEKPSPAPNGSNDTFYLIGKPIDKNSTLVFVDDLAVDPGDWSLIEGLYNGSIKFLGSAIPTVGQTIYVIYFLNVLALSPVPPPPPQVSSGGYITFGTDTAAQVLSVSPGLVPSSDQRQLHFVKSAGGGLVIPISNGSIVGQELNVVGVDSANYPIFMPGANLSINGPINLKANNDVMLIWGGSQWRENNREG